jgi:hypothetical protein
MEVVENKGSLGRKEQKGKMGRINQARELQTWEVK